MARTSNRNWLVWSSFGILLPLATHPFAAAQQTPSLFHDLPLVHLAAGPHDSAQPQDTSSAPSMPGSAPAHVMATDAEASAFYTLEQLQAMAVQNSPTIQSALAEIERIQGLRCQAGLKPNPTFGYFGSQLADQGTDQHGLFLEQQFVRGNKLELNRSVWDQSLVVAQNQLVIVRQKVETDIQKLYFQTVAAELKLLLIRDFQNVANHGVEIAQKRLEAEEASQVEVLQARTLKTEVEMSERQALATLRGAKAQLAALTGLPPQSHFAVDPQLPQFPESIDWTSELASLRANSPALALAHSQLCEAERFLQRQQVQAIPNLTAQLGAGVDNGTNSGMINLQLSAPLPVRNRNQGNIAAARANYQKAAAEVQRIENQLGTTIAKVQADFESQLAAVQNLHDGILPQIKETLDLSEKAYVAGELDFLQVAVIRKNLYESQIRWIDARMELSQTMARLQGLMLEGALDPTDTFGLDGLRDQSLTGE